MKAVRGSCGICDYPEIYSDQPLDILTCYNCGALQTATGWVGGRIGTISEPGTVWHNGELWAVVDDILVGRLASPIASFNTGLVASSKTGFDAGRFVIGLLAVAALFITFAVLNP